MLKQQLGAALEVLVSQAKIQGEGTMTLPGSPVPSVCKGDMARDPAADYHDASISGAEDGVLYAWIRRAVHAEAFAKALQADLEKLRSP